MRPEVGEAKCVPRTSTLPSLYFSRNSRRMRRAASGSTSKRVLRSRSAHCAGWCMTSPVITGDVMHHPAQCADLDLKTRFDVDPDAARRMRREFLEKYKDGKVLVLGTHFASPTSGRILRDGAAFRFQAS